MAHGQYHDAGLSWEWDSVLLLSNPVPLPSPSLEAEGSGRIGLRERLGSTRVSSSDYVGLYHSLRGSNETSSNHVHAGSRSSETRSKDSTGDHGRDPRLDCPNFLAGRVPCACTDDDDDDSGVSRKRWKSVPRCQVAACGAELTDLKGYHQRHRVCLRCAHATRVILREQPHRYCQQCGKFHPICDFDEGKRSCRRKLEKHNNRRRRKAGEDCLPASDYGDTDNLNEGSPEDGTKVDTLSEVEVKESTGEKKSFDVEDTSQTSRILSETTLSVVMKGSDTTCLSEMSDNILSQSLEPGMGTGVRENGPTAEQTTQHTEVSQYVELQVAQHQPSPLAERVHVPSESHQQSIHAMCQNDYLHGCSPHSETDVPMRRENDEESLLTLLMDDDNRATEGSQFSQNDGEHLLRNQIQLWGPTSPRGLSKEVAYLSPLPTGRISFKLYDWNPGDFPRQLRQQIVEWLSNMPVDLEGYIRSGCTILTIFVAMPQAGWDELSADWASSVLKLVKAEKSLSRFWSSGYLIARLDKQEVHINNGDLARPFSRKLCEYPILDGVRPLCLETGREEEVVILGQNFQQPQSRLLVSFDGKYVMNGAYQFDMLEKNEGAVTGIHDAENGEGEKLFCRMPALPSTSSGTAYIEVEHKSGISNYIPLLVAEKDIVDEVRSLEKEIDRPCNPNVHRRPDFPHLSQKRAHTLLSDLGWVLKNVYQKNFESDLRAEILELYLVRLRRLLYFAVTRSWYNVVKRVLQLSNRARLLEKVGVLDKGLSVLQLAVFCHEEFMVDHLISCAESLRASSSQCKFWWNLGFPWPKGLTVLPIVASQLGREGLCNVLVKKTDHQGQSPPEYFTWKKLSHTSKIRDVTTHTERNLEEEDPQVTSNDCLDVVCIDKCSLKMKDQRAVSLSSLPCCTHLPKIIPRATVGMTWQRLPVSRFLGHQGLTMYISSGRKRRYQLLSSATILLICVGLSVMGQCHNEVIMLSLSLEQCLIGLQHESKCSTLLQYMLQVSTVSTLLQESRGGTNVSRFHSSFSNGMSSFIPPHRVQIQ